MSFMKELTGLEFSGSTNSHDPSRERDDPLPLFGDYSDDKKREKEKKKESSDDFYARMQREEEERMEKKKRMKEEKEKQKRKDREAWEQSRIQDEEEARLNEEQIDKERRDEREARERDAIEREAKRHSLRVFENPENEDEEKKRRIERERELVRKERELYDREIRRKEKSQEQEKQELEAKMRKLQDERVQSEMKWFLERNEAMNSDIDSKLAKTAADAAADTERIKREFMKETEAQKSLNRRTLETQQKMDDLAREEKEKTASLVAAVDASVEAARKSAERNHQAELKWMSIRDSERAEILRNSDENAAKFREETESLRRDHLTRHEDAVSQMREEAQEQNAIFEKLIREEKEADARTTAQILHEHELLNAEIRKRNREKEEERMRQFYEIVENFGRVLRFFRQSLLNEEYERRWDEHFIDLRRAYYPVQSVFSDLNKLRFDSTNLLKSLAEFEGLLHSLSLSLASLQDMMTKEVEQIKEWKQLKPLSLFLDDLEIAVSDIVIKTRQAKEELESLSIECERNRDDSVSLEIIFKMEYLRKRMGELEEAVEKIPTVRKLNQKYGQDIRTHTTV